MTEAKQIETETGTKEVNHATYADNEKSCLFCKAYMKKPDGEPCKSCNDSSNFKNIDYENN